MKETPNGVSFSFSDSYLAQARDGGGTLSACRMIVLIQVGLLAGEAAGAGQLEGAEEVTLAEEAVAAVVILAVVAGTGVAAMAIRVVVEMVAVIAEAVAAVAILAVVAGTGLAAIVIRAIGGTLHPAKQVRRSGAVLLAAVRHD